MKEQNKNGYTPERATVVDIALIKGDHIALKGVGLVLQAQISVGFCSPI